MEKRHIDIRVLSLIYMFFGLILTRWSYSIIKNAAEAYLDSLILVAFGTPFPAPLEDSGWDVMGIDGRVWIFPVMGIFLVACLLASIGGFGVFFLRRWGYWMVNIANFVMLGLYVFATFAPPFVPWGLIPISILTVITIYLHRQRRSLR